MLHYMHKAVIVTFSNRLNSLEPIRTWRAFCLLIPIHSLSLSRTLCFSINFIYTYIRTFYRFANYGILFLTTFLSQMIYVLLVLQIQANYYYNQNSLYNFHRMHSHSWSRILSFSSLHLSLTLSLSLSRSLFTLFSFYFLLDLNFFQFSSFLLNVVCLTNKIPQLSWH